MKNKIKLIIASALSIICVASTYVVFTNDAIIPKFPYKTSLITTKIKNANVNNQSIKNYLAIDKESILNQTKEKAEEAQQASIDLNEQLKSFSTPTGIDYGSALIFIEQKTIEYNLQVLDIKFEEKESGTNSLQELQNQQQNQEQNQETQENTPVQEETNSQPSQPTMPNMDNSNSLQAIGEYKPSVVKVKVIGAYSDIQNYLENLPKELGDFNYIDNFTMWKSTESLAKEGANTNNNYLFEDEKNMIVSFDIVMYNKQ